MNKIGINLIRKTTLLRKNIKQNVKINNIKYFYY